MEKGIVAVALAQTGGVANRLRAEMLRQSRRHRGRPPGDQAGGAIAGEHPFPFPLLRWEVIARTGAHQAGLAQVARLGQGGEGTRLVGGGGGETLPMQTRVKAQASGETAQIGGHGAAGPSALFPPGAAQLQQLGAAGGE